MSIVDDVAHNGKLRSSAWLRGPGTTCSAAAELQQRGVVCVLGQNAVTASPRVFRVRSPNGFRNAAVHCDERLLSGVKRFSCRRTASAACCLRAWQESCSSLTSSITKSPSLPGWWCRMSIVIDLVHDGKLMILAMTSMSWVKISSCPRVASRMRCPRVR